ncbi:putative nuclear control of ATPase protein [Triangularia verruculosa]|uniref:Nuclear control of ATPase protein n=1 Tax=Triangularia verruculosa TaxID=2587418 RepID=A0AAN7AZG8_9PEZI|nr:putative nuclear control of ATPase protein [Triangularia verruculosa]
MSIVADRVRRLDALIDKVSLAPLGLGEDQDEQFQGVDHIEVSALTSPRVTELLQIAKGLSSSSLSLGHVSKRRIRNLLIESGLTDEKDEQFEAKSALETDAEWMLVGKATVQTYGLMMSTLLDQITPLSDDIWYWDDILSSYPNSLLYTMQTTPVRMGKWTKEIWLESLDRFKDWRLQQLGHRPGPRFRRESKTQSEVEGVSIVPSLHSEDESDGEEISAEASATGLNLTQQWRQFYGIVRESITEKSLSNIRHQVLSRVDIGRSDARRKLARLQKLREMTASGLGMLLDEGLDLGISAQEDGTYNEEWRLVLERSVALMDSTLRGTLMLGLNMQDFEDRVFQRVDEDPELSLHIEDIPHAARPAILARRLLSLLDEGIPQHSVSASALARKNGRPSRLVRYWIPAIALLLSSSTILRFLVSRKADIIDWIRDLGATTRDFWFNWVVEPTRKVIGTIRHDETSEIAIMSRDSLKADRESLERMVVEFSLDNPDIAVGNSTITETQIAEIRTRVKEGDVTPILKAYEKDLKKPFVGAIRGDLVRSVLIQVQKTKVDLEVAISGIDALLKSQELVFGFIGLTPGILVSIGIIQYFRTAFGSRKGLRRGKQARRTRRVLRKMDKILTESQSNPQSNNIISYRDRGLLVCEAHVLRNLAQGILPREVEKEFVEDLDEFAKARTVPELFRVLDRIRWAYAEWLGSMK